MDDVRVGRLLRALRRRRGLRQADVARAAGLSQQSVSLVERGHLATLSLRTIRSMFGALDARFEGLVTWRGGEVDRVLDERHARLVGAIAERLRQHGWDVHVEVTFSVYGDRGSIDILAVRPRERLALVVEAKSEIASIDETIRRLDVKDRLASLIVTERLDWKPVVVSRLLAVADDQTARRRVALHGATLMAAFPTRGTAVRRWLASPSGRLSGLLFQRVRR